MDEISDNDKLMAALSYPISIIAIVILLSETNKARPFQKFHAVQSLAVNVALGIVFSILCVVLSITGVLACLTPIPGVAWLVYLLYLAYRAYQGEYVEVPWVTEFIRQQGWV
jgi:uncharacterized membrane protein